MTIKNKGGEMNNISKATTADQVSKIYGIPQGTLANMRCRKEGPKYYKINSRVIYFLADVEKWLMRNPVLTRDSIQ
jgi:hypothetical protein